MRLRAWWTYCMAACFGLAAFVHAADAATLTLDEARGLARDAFERGDVSMANALAKGLVKARPEDADALLMLAATESMMGRPGSGRDVGRKAFRAAKTPKLKHQAAYVTSGAALAEGRYTAAQYWLRRAYHLAEDDEDRASVARAFARVRRESPWSARLDFSVAPTSNVNGGTEAKYLVINDEATGGLIGSGSRALAGTRMTMSVDLSYRLAQRKQHETVVSFYGLRTWNRLSEDDTGREGSDFDYGVAEVELTHRRADLPAPLPDTISIALGQVWSGLEPYERVGRVTLSRRFRLGAKTSLRVTGEAERRLSDRGAQDRDGTKLQFALSRDIGVAIARLSVAQTDVRSDNRNADYTGKSVRLALAQSEDMAGIRFSGSLSWAEKVYSAHSGGLFFAATERRDETRTATVSAHLERFDMMGFAPVVTYTAQQTDSNFSIYESRSYGWSLGLRSSF